MKEMINMEISQLKEMAKQLKEQVALDTYPVGVKFVFSDQQETPKSAVRLPGHRYCQALMKARHGEHVILDKDGITCPAAAAAFGFKPLPDSLKSGKALVGFGITGNENTGMEMFRGITALDPGELKELYLFPLETAIIEPDIVVIEDKIETLMWFALAYLNVNEGRRVESSTAILQAACVDATIIPYKHQIMNLSYGCYGCRDATDIEPGETVLGFPNNMFEVLAESIDYLSEKAIPNSRNKNAYSLLNKKKAEEILRTDVFQANSEKVS
jgi:uncharacterized protein (DUF169 family)